MAIELDEKELETLLTEVQGAVSALASEDLAKSEKADDKEEEAKEVEKCGEVLPVKKEEEKPEAKEEAKEEMEKAEEPSKEEKEEDKKEEMKKDEPPAEEKPAEEPAPEAPAEDAAPEEDLDAKLSALDDDKLKHLYMACKKALFSRMSANEAPAPEAPEAPAPAPEMEKAEEPAKEEKEEDKKEELKDMKKSEEFNELQAQNELLHKALTLLATPLRKGITGISQVAPAKAEKDVTKMSKSEVIETLNEKAFQADLKKSDRELINGYCLGLVSLDKITHLLK
jgi:hypothetical protein